MLSKSEAIFLAVVAVIVLVVPIAGLIWSVTVAVPTSAWAAFMCAVAVVILSATLGVVLAEIQIAYDSGKNRPSF